MRLRSKSREEVEDRERERERELSATSCGRPSTSERICGIDRVRVSSGVSEFGLRESREGDITWVFTHALLPLRQLYLYLLLPRGSAHSVCHLDGGACVGY